MACMRDAKFLPGSCRELSKSYLECRMERELMAKDDMANLGYHAKADAALAAAANNATREEGQKESEGFIAGLHIARRKGFFEGWFSPKPRGGHG